MDAFEHSAQVKDVHLAVLSGADTCSSGFGAGFPAPPRVHETKLHDNLLGVGASAPEFDSKESSLDFFFSKDFSKEHKPMIDFIQTALFQPHCFAAQPKPPHDDTTAAVNWIAERSAEQIIQEREATLKMLEDLAAKCIANGSCHRWFDGVDPCVQQVAEHVNGPLLLALVNHCDYHDKDCVDFFRHGANSIGLLNFSGNGAPKNFPEHESIDSLRASALARNTALLKTLREDINSDALMELTTADAKLHRMGHPVPVECVDLSSIILAPRFAVVQGLKPDGTPKIRAVDDETRSGCNGCCQPCEKLSVDSIDSLVSLMQMFAKATGVLPHLMKDDINAAYRRVPLKPDHRWATWVAFVHHGRVMVAEHKAMAFGSLASVYNWDRIGELLCFLARRLLHIPILRYVDDYFAPELPACADHAAHAFARMVRLLLGPTAISESKLLWGMPLEILGLDVEVNPVGIKCKPTVAKSEKWLGQIQQALDSKTLLAGHASKLAGALQWATAHMFDRLGRAMIRPIFLQQKKRHGRVGKSLEVALRWWLQVLKLEIVQTCPWSLPETAPVQLFADARGEPPRLAAVLFMDGERFYTDWEPTAELMNLFTVRKDAQIMGLELLAIAIGLCTFADKLQSRKICIWSDNTGSEATTDKGTAKSWDHARIVHSIWLKAAMIKAHLWVDRVPTKENIADLPSRMEYQLLLDMGAQFVKPVLDDMFWKPEAWSELSAKCLR